MAATVCGEGRRVNRGQGGQQSYVDAEEDLELQMALSRSMMPELNKPPESSKRAKLTQRMILRLDVPPQPSVLSRRSNPDGQPATRRMMSTHRPLEAKACDFGTERAPDRGKAANRQALRWC